MPAGSSPRDSDGAGPATDCTQKLLFLWGGGCKGRIPIQLPVGWGEHNPPHHGWQNPTSITGSRGGHQCFRDDGFWIRGSKWSSGGRQLEPLLIASPALCTQTLQGFSFLFWLQQLSISQWGAGKRMDDSPRPPSPLAHPFRLPPEEEEAPAAAEMQNNKPTASLRILFSCLATNTDRNNSPKRKKKKKKWENHTESTPPPLPAVPPLLHSACWAAACAGGWAGACLWCNAPASRRRSAGP